jgi:uncharacterized protein (DUF885 family)
MKAQLILLLALSLPAMAGKPPEDNATKHLAEIVDKYWNRELKENFFLDEQVGQPVSTIESVSESKVQEKARFARSVLDELAQIDPTQLPHDQWLIYRKVQFLAAQKEGDAKYFWLAPRVTPYTCAAPPLEKSLSRFVFKTTEDSGRFITLLHDYGRYVQSLTDFLTGQHDRKIILPKAEIAAVSGMLHAFATDPENRLKVDPTRLRALAPAERDSLREQGHNIVTQEIKPAFDRLVTYVDGPYGAGAPVEVGLSQYPNGREYYTYLVKLSTTLDIAPKALHDLGLKEVARIDHELDSIRHTVHFEGDLASFRTFLKTDRRFYCPTGEGFGAKLRDWMHRSEAKWPLCFSRKPAAAFAIEPLPAALAGAQTFGFYEWPSANHPQGTYYYNASHPESTSTLSSAALVLHELIPGHYFQIGLQQENEKLPNLCRFYVVETGFSEGWGEYASQLGFEMGLYDDPYDHAGRLMLDAMITSRLVVDTGMNYFGWSRERAKQFLSEHTVLREPQIDSELLRYSTDLPAQALAYKTGEMTFLDLRETAKRKLGKKFDLREFHSWLLDSGSMSLDTLRQHVAYEIARRQKEAP